MTVERAEYLLELNRPRDAVGVLQAALGTDPTDGNVWCLLGRAHLALGELEAALGAADRGAACGPSDAGWPHRIRAIALRRLGFGPAALDAARTAVGLGPQVCQNHVALADAMLGFPGYVCPRPPAPGGTVPRPGRYSRGPWWYTRAARRAVHARIAAVAERALELGPDNTDALLTLAWARRLQGRREDSLALADRALALSPDNPHVHQQRAAILASRGRLGGAASGFGRAAALDPGGRAAADFAGVCRRAINRGFLLGLLTWLVAGSVFQALIDPYAPGAGLGRRCAFLGAAAGVCTLAALTPFARLLAPLSRPERVAAVRSVVRNPELVLRSVAIAGLLVLVVLVPGDSVGGPLIDVAILVLLFVAIAARPIVRVVTQRSRS